MNDPGPIVLWRMRGPEGELALELTRVPNRGYDLRARLNGVPLRWQHADIRYATVETVLRVGDRLRENGWRDVDDERV